MLWFRKNWRVIFKDSETTIRVGSFYTLNKAISFMEEVERYFYRRWLSEKDYDPALLIEIWHFDKGRWVSFYRDGSDHHLERIAIAGIANKMGISLDG